MRSLGGFILLAGMGVALFVYLPAPVESGPSFEQVQRAARVAQLPQRFKPVARLSAFSPLIALTIPARRGTRVAKLDPAPAPMPVATDAPSGWQTVVAATPTSTPPQPTTLVPRDPDNRYKLVLDIQQQLGRVGCYWGGMDGSWGIADAQCERVLPRPRSCVTEPSGMLPLASRWVHRRPEPTLGKAFVIRGLTASSLRLPPAR